MITYFTARYFSIPTRAIALVITALTVAGVSANLRVHAQTAPVITPTASEIYCPAYADSALYRTRATQITLSPDDDWQQIIATAEPDTEILLQDGVYELTKYAVLIYNDITLRSATGNRSAVILKGPGYATGAEGWTISGNNVTIAELTVTGMRDHAVAIKPELGALMAPHIYGVHLYDIGTQHIKLSPGGTRNGLSPAHQWATHWVPQSVTTMVRSICTKQWTGPFATI